MVDVQFGATHNQLLHGVGVELSQLRRISFERVEERRVTDQRDFHSFDVACAFVARIQRAEHVEVVDYGKGHSEGSDEILLSEGVHSVLHADARIVLAQGGGWDADMTNTAMRGGSGQSD